MAVPPAIARLDAGAAVVLPIMLWHWTGARRRKVRIVGRDDGKEAVMQKLSRRCGPALKAAVAAMALALLCLVFSTPVATGQKRSWDDLPVITMHGGLQVFWNVIDNTGGENEAQAAAHGFAPVALLNTYADYPGGQKENIQTFVGRDSTNPWNKPAFFERIIRRNINQKSSAGVYVHDIEFDFEEDVAKAWSDKTARDASGAKEFSTFEAAYFREWASWFWLPLQWAKERYADARVGLYGPQPFRRDYWGIAGKNAAQIDGTHRTDWALWKYIDPYVDFYIASIYVFYERPESVFYMAANVEENYTRTRELGNKPIYAYQWLRYHESNRALAGRELDPYLVEAMAVVPFFSGARGVVLWGYEPQLKREYPPYQTLPLYMKNLERIARLSEIIGRATVALDEPAHVAWKERRPLVRRLLVGEDECLILAINPWQSEGATTRADVACGKERYPVAMEGRSTTLVHIVDNRLQAY